MQHRSWQERPELPQSSSDLSLGSLSSCNTTHPGLPQNDEGTVVYPFGLLTIIWPLSSLQLAVNSISTAAPSHDAGHLEALNRSSHPSYDFTTSSQLHSLFPFFQYQVTACDIADTSHLTILFASTSKMAFFDPPVGWQLPSLGKRRISLLVTPLLCYLSEVGDALHHMDRPPIAYVSRRDDSVPLGFRNLCDETIYPGIVTQSGTPPSSGGFQLESGESRRLSVSADWQGRIWGRTNCSFNYAGTGPSNKGGNNGGGRACGSGDCGGIVNCRATVCAIPLPHCVDPDRQQGETPVTLAEFTLATSSGQTFYDISLVDGYNIPMGIVSLYSESDDPALQDIPPNLTNPICIGSVGLLGPKGSTSDATGSNFGTNSSFPIPLEQSVSSSDVASWCPWDLQQDPPTKPGDGVYPYPDDKIQRPAFGPCLSACAKYSKAQDCCTGSYNDPNKCKASLYSKQAKKVCPDAYSFAFDDQTSTFIVPQGGGFETVFCPSGRSSNILKILGIQLRQLAATGHVSPDMLASTQNVTVVRNGNERSSSRARSVMILALAVVPMLLIWA